jgi:hypothetical protein
MPSASQHRQALRADTKRGYLGRGLRAAIPIETSLPDPLADALERAEAAIARQCAPKNEVFAVTVENPPMDYLDV